MSIINISKNNDYIFKILFILIIFTAEKTFYLLNNLNLFNIIKLDDICLILVFIFSVYCYYKCHNLRYRNSKKRIFIFFTIICIVFVFLSSFQAFFRFGQPIILGLRPQRLLALALIVFPLLKYMYCFPEIYIWIKKTLEKMSVFALIIYIFQYILLNKILFLNVYITSRLGENRLHFDSVLLNLGIFIFFQKLLCDKKNKLKNLIIIFLFSYYNLFVIKGRLTLIGIIVSILILLILYSKNKTLTIYFVTFFIIILSLFILYKVENSIIYKYYNNVINEVISGSGNYEIRESGKKFLINSIRGHEVLGNGYLNELFLPTTQILGLNYGYKLIDNGLIAIKILYGSIAELIFFIVYFILLIKSYKLIRKKEIFFLGYFINLGIIMINIIPLFWGTGPVYLGILVSLISFKINEEKGDDFY